MDENNVVTNPVGTEGKPEGTANPNPNPGAETPKTDKPVVKKKKGLIAKTKSWCKNNKKALLAGAAGLVAGVGGTIGVAEVGKRQAERKARRNACIQQEAPEYSPLDPNV